MHDWFTDAIARLGSDPVLQAIVAALSTFILEDPTTVGCGLLVADGRMAFATAFIGVASGIAIGDIGLYCIGRLAGPRFKALGIVSPAKLDRSSDWIRRNVVAAVLFSRFVPGTRLVTYVAAGLLHAPLRKFAITAVFASIIWTGLLLTIIVSLGELILPVLGQARWPIAIAAVLLFILYQRRSAARAKQRREQPRHKVSGFEFLSPVIFYAPLIAHYAWLSIRYRNTMLPTLANPSMYAGGLIGESKSEALDLVDGSARRWIAPYVTIALPDAATEEEIFALAQDAIDDAGLAFPLVVKPDMGQRGDGVQPVYDTVELRDYLSRFPRGPRLMIQKLAVEEPKRATTVPEGNDIRSGEFHEAGVLYWRMPGSDKGEIFSITLKVMPKVIGDGHRTVRELIEANFVARRAPDLYLGQHAAIADRILDDGEILPLVFAGNHCKGAVFFNATPLATPQLLDRCEQIAAQIPEFYYGRFDVRFDDFDAFLAGEDFQIIEINGAGAEAIHIWDPSTHLLDAYATLFEQARIVFRIGAANRSRGYRTKPLRTLFRDILAYRRTSRLYPHASNAGAPVGSAASDTHSGPLVIDTGFETREKGERVLGTRFESLD